MMDKIIKMIKIKLLYINKIVMWLKLCKKMIQMVQ